MDLQEKLVHSFKTYDLQLNGSKDAASHQLRRKAMETFEKMGFPTPKNEEWKYTNLKRITRSDYKIGADQTATIDKATVDHYLLENTDSYRVVLVNGKFEATLSNLPEAKVSVRSFAEALASGEERVLDYMATVAPEDHPMVALNTAMAVDGVYVHVPKGVVLDKLVELFFITDGGEADTILNHRNLIVVEDNAQMQLLERHRSIGNASVFTNVVTEAFVGKDANYKHYKIQNDQESAAMVDNTWVRQDTQSVATVDTFSFGGKFVRNNLSFMLKGEHCESNMDAITINGEGQLTDHHTFVDHAIPNCNSNQLYKAIYDGNAKGVFNGKIMVQCDAQKTNAFQQNNNVLLSDRASIETKPQLEIFADDVACSHGCTVGQIDEDAMFYMRSRGIAEKEAKAILLYAFSNDALKNVGIPELQNKINKLIAKRLSVDIDFDL